MTGPEILTVDQLAKLLQVHISTVYRMIRTGDLPCFRVGSDFRFKRVDIDAWIEKRMQGGR